MAERRRPRQRLAHQLRAEAETAPGRIDRERAEHQRRAAGAGRDVPQAHGAR